jgi:hypothetical protein
MNIYFIQGQDYLHNSPVNSHIDSCAFGINGEIMKHPFIIDMDSIVWLNIVKDTLIQIDDKKYDKYLSITYKRTPVTLIPLEQVDNAIYVKYRDFCHIYMINDEFIEKSPSDLLIDRDYIEEVKLINYSGFADEKKNPKVLIIKIYTRGWKKAKQR